jgi:hypothetical protein
MLSNEWAFVKRIRLLPMKKARVRDEEEAISE